VYFLRFIFIFILFGAASVGYFPALSPSSFAQSLPAKKAQSARKKAVIKSRKQRSSPRLRRMRLAFVASSSLKPMARQLLQDRTPSAYAGVESYARRHGSEDAGALAWLVLGYAHTLDHDYAQAIPALSRAHPHAGDIGDYVDYYRGQSYLQTGRVAEAIAVLSDFEKRYPESLLVVDARLLYANLLMTEGQPQAAVALLEQNRKPVRAEIELVLGRAYAASGDNIKATAIFSNLYFAMPLSFEATLAGEELKKASPATVTSAALNERRERADLLAKGKRYSEAADEYRALLNEVSAAERPALQLSMVEALRHSGRIKEAKQALESVRNSPPEINAGRLFNLGEIAWDENDNDTFLKTLDELRQADPTSAYLEQALLKAGNVYLLKPDYDRAIDSYRELQSRFPSASKASYAHWKVAWLSLRQGRNAEAKTEFENQIGLFPDSGEVPSALYWRARLAQEDGDMAMAAAYYQKLSLRFRNYYYGELAREQLHKINANGPAQHYALLDRVPPMNSDAAKNDSVPTDDLRVQKAHLLENGALLDFAVRELKAANEQDKGDWLPAETARMYEDAGRYDIAIEVLKRAVPNYFAVDLDSLPRSYWEALFPKPYWFDLKRFSSTNGLDPYLVASLIRQESEFNPNAVSRKDAVGLMQLLPKVGKTLAKQQKIKHYKAAQLFTPGMNLELGTRYFRQMVDKFGAFEYALAAYNAGTDRVQNWLGDGKYRDPQEFVESIPFTETREYVQAILRNANMYRQLYGTP
jgi:soluble lytic murein transglycosylase